MASIRFLAAISIMAATLFIVWPRDVDDPQFLGAAITPNNGRVDFVAAHDPHTYWELNSTNLGTGFGDDTTGNDDNAAVSSGDISTSGGYEGMNSQNDDGTNGWFDIYTVTDAAMLLYIPAGLTHGTNYGLFHNGGGTNAQSAFLRATVTGVELACNHNANGADQDALIEEIPDADLPGWFVFSCQYASYGGSQGDMALWLNGVAERSGTRSYQLAYGSGDPDFGNSGGDEPLAARVLDPAGYSGGDWSANTAINSSGILIANFAVDNPNKTNTSPPGNGDSFHEDYYTYHVSTPASDTCTYSGSGDWVINSSDSCNVNTLQWISGNIYLVDTGTGGLYVTSNGTLSVGGRIESTSTPVYVGSGGTILLGDG